MKSSTDLVISLFSACSIGKRSGHIPYRDSKLTRILQLSLGGNARTAIICMLSPAMSHVEQSRNTLSFATRAKEVTNSAQVNMVLFLLLEIPPFPIICSLYNCSFSSLTIFYPIVESGCFTEANGKTFAARSSQTRSSFAHPRTKILFRSSADAKGLENSGGIS